MSSEHDYYTLLGLPDGSSVERVHEQYRHLVKVYHPDRNPGDREWCEEQLRRVTEAYHHLSDPARKAAYDRRHIAIVTEPIPPSAWTHLEIKQPMSPVPNADPTADEPEDPDSEDLPDRLWRSAAAVYESAQARVGKVRLRTALLVAALLIMAPLCYSVFAPPHAPRRYLHMGETSTARTLADASSAAGSETDDPGKTIEAIRAPLLDHFNRVTPAIDLALKGATQASNAIQNTPGQHSAAQDLKLQDLRYSVLELQRLQIAVKGGIDDLDTWTPKEQWHRRILDIDDDFRKLDQQIKVVTQETQAVQAH